MTDTEKITLTTGDQVSGHCKRENLFWIALGCCTIVLERIGVPVGSTVIPIMVILTPVTVFAALSMKYLVASATRVILFSALIVCGAVSALLGSSSSPLTSLAQVIFLWCPVLFSRTSLGSRTAQSFIAGVAWTVVAGSVLALPQSAISAATGVFIDPIATIPSQFQVTGFNTTFPVVYGQAWMRANGMIFLEPSFLSLFAVIALVYFATGQRRQPWVTAFVCIVLTAGLITSVAVSGLVVLPVLVIYLFTRRHGGPIVVAAIALLAILSQTLPVLQFLVDKAQQDPFDTTGQVSSAARLYRPYLILPSLIDKSPLVGSGPGAARDFTQSLNVEVTTPTLMKALVEYGLLGASIFVILIAVHTAGSNTPVALRIAILVALIIPTDGLTSAVLVPLFAFGLLGLDHKSLRVFVSTEFTRGHLDSRPEYNS